MVSTAVVSLADAHGVVCEVHIAVIAWSKVSVELGAVGGSDRSIGSLRRRTTYRRLSAEVSKLYWIDRKVITYISAS